MRKTGSSGLSGGAIVAIIIPLIVLLIVIGLIIGLVKSGIFSPKIPPINKAVESIGSNSTNNIFKSQN